MRHWNQHYDFEADLIFLKRMIVRGYGVDIAQPGDPVPQRMKDHFGKHRLKIWWEGGYIALAEPEALPKDAEQTKDLTLTTGTLDTTKATVAEDGDVHVGGGYYDVTRGGVTTRIRGKKNIPV